MDSRNRIKIRWVSFALAISVIYIHAYNVEVYQLTESYGLGKILYRLEDWLNRMQTACVPAFFMISGYLFFRNYSWNKVWHKYKSRVKSLLIPYLLWCTLYFLFYFLITRIPVIATHMNMEKVPFSFLYYLQCLWDSAYTVLWFIKSLILVIIGTPFYYAVMKKRETLLGEGISITLSIVLIVFSIVGDSHVLNSWFLIGCFLAVRFSKQVEEVKKSKTIIGIIGFVLCTLWLFPEGKESNWVWIVLTIFSAWNALDIIKFLVNPNGGKGKLSFFIVGIVSF